MMEILKSYASIPNFNAYVHDQNSEAAQPARRKRALSVPMNGSPPR